MPDESLRGVVLTPDGTPNPMLTAEDFPVSLVMPGESDAVRAELGIALDTPLFHFRDVRSPAYQRYTYD